MNLHEYQSKLIFSKYGVPIPRGRVASTASEVRQIAEELGGRVVIKSQVLVGGRGKAGGIRLAKSPLKKLKTWRLMFSAWKLKACRCGRCWSMRP
jgi:succinyl-CoA synthetase beta subunit